MKFVLVRGGWVVFELGDHFLGEIFRSIAFGDVRVLQKPFPADNQSHNN
jgi:hypothetical protein